MTSCMQFEKIEGESFVTDIMKGEWTTVEYERGALKMSLFFCYFDIPFFLFPSVMRYSCPYSLCYISPKWLTLYFFKLQAWRHTGIAILKSMH